MKTFIVIIAVSSALIYGAIARGAASTTRQGIDAHRLTIDQLIDIKHPSFPIWSPDGRHIAFLWDRAGISDWYVIDVDAGDSRPRALTTNSAAGSVFWSRDSQALYVQRAGALWQMPVGGGEGKPLWSATEPASNIVMSPDGTRVAFVRGGGAASGGGRRGGGAGGRGPSGAPGGGDLIVRSLADGTDTRVAHDDV